MVVPSFQLGHGFLAFSILVGCVSALFFPGPATAQSARGKVTYLNQAWSPEDRDGYYRFSQCSAVICYDIIVNLEVAEASGYFEGTQIASATDLAADYRVRSDDWFSERCTASHDGPFVRMTLQSGLAAWPALKILATCRFATACGYFCRHATRRQT
jgi:hypothetical protein